jgi:hypothetical protein
MSLPIYVDGYSGYKVNEHPTGFELDGTYYQIYALEAEWNTPDGHFFKVRADGKRLILRYNETNDEWTLQSAPRGPVSRWLRSIQPWFVLLRNKSNRVKHATLSMRIFLSIGFSIGWQATAMERTSTSWNRPRNARTANEGFSRRRWLSPSDVPLRLERDHISDLPTRPSEDQSDTHCGGSRLGIGLHPLSSDV